MRREKKVKKKKCAWNACKGLTKRLMHFCNIVGDKILHTSSHPAAMCCNILQHTESCWIKLEKISNFSCNILDLYDVILVKIKFFMQHFGFVWCYTRWATFTQHCKTRACLLGPLVSFQGCGEHKRPHLALKILNLMLAFGQPVQHMTQHHATLL